MPPDLPAAWAGFERSKESKSRGRFFSLAMSILRKFFIPSVDEHWRELSEQLGGHFLGGGRRRGSQVRVDHKQWTITLDTYMTEKGMFTRMRAPFVSKDNFRFTIYQRSLFTDVAKRLGIQDDEIGVPEFDDAYFVKCNDTFKLRKMFASQTIRGLIERQPKIYLAVRDDDGRFSALSALFPEGIDELYCRIPGMIKEVRRLKDLYDLFAEVLEQLCRIGSAYEDDPGIILAPGSGQGSLPLAPPGSKFVTPFEKMPRRAA